MSSFKIRAAAIPAGLILCAAVSAGSDFYYPPTGRTETQQRQDKYECHEWAVAQSKFDPAEYAAKAPTTTPASSMTAQQPTDPKTDSQAGKSMVAGAATGALVGEAVNNDAGNGAIYGGAAGLLRGRMADKKASAEKAAAQQQQKQMQLQQQQAAANQDIRTKQNDYSRARSTCFKARGYTVSEG